MQERTKEEMEVYADIDVLDLLEVSDAADVDIVCDLKSHKLKSQPTTSKVSVVKSKSIVHRTFEVDQSICYNAVVFDSVKSKRRSSNNRLSFQNRHSMMTHHTIL